MTGPSTFYQPGVLFSIEGLRIDDPFCAEKLREEDGGHGSFGPCGAAGEPGMIGAAALDVEGRWEILHGDDRGCRSVKSSRTTSSQNSAKTFGSTASTWDDSTTGVMAVSQEFDSRSVIASERVRFKRASHTVELHFPSTAGAGNSTQPNTVD